MRWASDVFWVLALYLGCLLITDPLGSLHNAIYIVNAIRGVPQ